jgi:preprotein translocase subunit SecA
VTVREEYQTLATITLQNYFRLYDKLSGMTGTAMTEASEFDKIYKLGVVPIPTNRPMQRVDNVDLVYRTEEAKYIAVAEDIAGRHDKGQPILIGTVSVEKSEYLSQALRSKGVPHSVLNAKQHADEAKIVALAGHKGAVTVATNMAGRGTDIMLGGSVDFLADMELRKEGLDPVENTEEYDAAWPAMVERIKARVAAEHDEVRDLGGLYVLGTERHESRRIDNQLRGRSGRQGDPGESRFYLSLQDELMRLFKSDWVDWVLTTLKVPDDVPIENKRVTNSIASAQSQVEAQNFDSRKNVLKYDDVMSRQREVIYAERRAVLEGADLHEQVRDMIDQTVAGYVNAATQGFPEEWDLEKLWTALRTLYPVSLKWQELEDEAGGVAGLDRDEMVERIKEQVATEHDEVRDLGGLYVVGTQRHESRRIAHPLRGRSGRQGDPGETRFYLSLQDELMRLFKSDWVDWVLTTLKVPDDQPIENKRVTGAIASAQAQVEAQNFDSRKNVLKYDDVMNRQREVIYGERRAVLEGADLHLQIREMIDEVVEGYVTAATDGFPEEWDLEALWQALKQLYPVSRSQAQVEAEAGGRDGLTRESLVEDLKADAQAQYDAHEQEFGEEVMRELERRVLLSVLDRKWREHLYEMDYLREGIGLRAYSQRDPLVEYQRAGCDRCGAMMDGIKEESVGYLFNLEVQVEPEEAEVEEIEVGPALAQAAAPDDHPRVTSKDRECLVEPQSLAYSSPSEDGAAEVSGAPQQVADDPYAGASRNAECPCGSGKKYQKCHGAPGGPTGLTTRVNG